MNLINFLILPVVGMLIGFFTNWLAIKFLFWPEKKILGIQGVIPKRKEKIAEKISSSSLKFMPDNFESIGKIPVIGKKFKKYLKQGVKKKIKNMNNKKLEKIIKSTSKKEFQFIRISGAVLGFTIGLVQAVILELI
jgi:uncharacterized membrane protein YheB (UPF0754 family)